MKKFAVILSFATLTSSVLGMNSQRLREEPDSKVNSRVPLRRNDGCFLEDECSDYIKIALSELSGLSCPISQQEYPDFVRSMLQQMAWSDGRSFVNELCDLIKDEDASGLDIFMNKHPEIMKDQFIKDALLIWSTKIRQEESVKYMIDFGANPNVKTEDGYTSLIYATKSNSTKIIEILVNSGADVNALSENQDTPIIWGVKHNNFSVVEFLIKHGADLNQKEKMGFTPLALAAKNNNFEMVKYLVEHGANVNVQNNDGDTPVQLAGKNKNREMVKFLIESIKPATAA